MEYNQETENEEAMRKLSTSVSNYNIIYIIYILENSNSFKRPEKTVRLKRCFELNEALKGSRIVKKTVLDNYNFEPFVRTKKNKKILIKNYFKSLQARL